MYVDKNEAGEVIRQFAVQQHEGQEWVDEVVPTLEQAKAVKLDEVNAAKRAARDGGFEVGGVSFDSDAEARVAYLELSEALDANPSFSTPWKASNGTWVTMDAALYAQVKAAGQAHIEAVFSWLAGKQAEIESAETVAEVEAIDPTF